MASKIAKAIEKQTYIMSKKEQEELFTFYQRYEFADNSKQEFMIQSFNQLGMVNPNGVNPSEDQNTRNNSKVYPESKFEKGKVIGTLFIPS